MMIRVFGIGLLVALLLQSCCNSAESGSGERSDSSSCGAEKHAPEQLRILSKLKNKIVSKVDDRNFAAMLSKVSHSDMSFAKVDEPFLKTHLLIRVSFGCKYYIVALDKETPNCLMITSRPKNFNKMIKSENLHVKEIARMKRYISTYMDLVAPSRSKWFLLESFDDIPYRPNLTEKRKEEKEKLDRIIGPLVCVPAKDGQTVTGFFLGASGLLCRYSFHVGNDGQVKLLARAVIADDVGVERSYL